MPIGIVFLSAGAEEVFKIFGLGFPLLCMALRVSLRRCGQIFTITITPGDLTVD